MTVSCTATISAFRPFRAAGAVFERDADGREAVADGVAGGEVLCGAGVGSELDEQFHHRVGRVRAPASPFGTAGAVFERDAGGGEAVADFVGDGEVFVFAGGGSQVDHEGH